MTTNSVDRIDRIEALLEKSIQATISYRQANREEMAEVRAVLSALAASQSNQNQQIKALVDASAATLAAVTRLEGIVEHMVYREGRGNKEGSV